MQITWWVYKQIVKGPALIDYVKKYLSTHVLIHVTREKVGMGLKKVQKRKRKEHKSLPDICKKYRKLWENFAGANFCII